ncbi:non-ribosomal peptide synthetase [Acaryochloris sp. IP29b_bin.137]|uniref:non-ribosomal peptide synthetase n=1 Tax=Acaryochloris sp. IP29b_bin.137 TaxID=2969217 RepID=UPI00260FBF3A|nr:non-ribosomal peptide synthetase [Acaryochloris sp. IP29b_bin.137]
MAANPSTLRSRIASLSSEKQQLLRQQLADKGIEWDEVVGKDIQVAPRPEQLPLSSSQQHLWVVHQLYPETCAYHIAITLQLNGNLNIDALTQSLQAIICRHESLRTVFKQRDSKPFQAVLPELLLEVPVVDLRSTSNISTEVRTWQQHLAHQPFNLATGPLIRAHLFQIQDKQFKLILILHHLIADGWSRGVLLQELATHYRAFAVGESVDLPALPLQYADFVLQQRQQSQQPDYQVHLDHWKQQLTHLTPLSLPGTPSGSTLGNNSPAIDFSSRTLTCTFSTDQTQAIKRFGQRSGATLFMVLLAVFKLLLHRYSGQRDIAVGVPVAGRSRADVEQLIGFFVNTLVLRTQLTGYPTFMDWLQQIRTTVADALQHQDVPFAEVLDILGVERVPGQNPLFQVMFQVQSGYQLQNAEQLALDMPGLSLIQSWVELNQTKFDMSWHVIERDDSLLIGVEYRTALFESDFVQHMLKHFQKLTESVLTHPEASIAQLPILPWPERQQLKEWGQGKVTAPIQCFPQRFEQQVEQTPDAIALRTPDQTLTYQALNQRANQLAHWLQSEGIGPDHLVGVCLDPGIDLIVALLATLKAGGAYVPLDPMLPSARLQYMVDDAAPDVLIVPSDEFNLLRSESHPVTLLSLSQDRTILATQSQNNLPTQIVPTNLAYVIYTPGSTGKPKGTLIEHRGLINYLDWCLASYPLTQGKGVPVQSSIGFDATITSLFAPLLSGQSLILGLGASDIESIQTALMAGVSLIKLTPAHLSALQPLLKVQGLAADLLPKALIIGGEALQAHHVAVWRSQYPDVALVNEYGPTEAVVGCCVHWVSPTDQDRIPIGHPIHGAQLYVLDEYFDSVPIGVPGELYIGGAGVARGYLNRPELTAERFIPNPFATVENPVLTLYRTGDQVCYRPDGVLDYLGRIDEQVKLHGFRIEPGEIEALLCEHPQVEQAIVLLSKVSQRPTLVAYVVAPNAVDTQLSAELRLQLHQALPAYMVPTHFIRLDLLPLTANGKVDRHALPTPKVVMGVQDQVLPQTEKESILSTIWQQILGRDDLSIHDNFFDLGGDSITAMQIVAKAHQQGLHLTPAQLFHHQTIASQAVVAEQQMAVDDAVLEGDAPLSPIQWDFFKQQYANPHHYNQSLMVVVDPEVNIDHLEAALQHLAHHHDALRLRFKPTESGWHQAYSAPEVVPFEVVDLILEAHAGSDPVATLQSSLDVTNGPLFRGALLRSVDNYRLLLVAHHLVVDGVSWRVILADLLTLYGQLSRQQVPSLAPKTTAFGDWTRHLQGLRFADEYSYWSVVCETAPTLPVDYKQGSNTIADHEEITLILEADQTHHLKTLKLPIQSILLTALGQTLTQWSRHSSVTVDLEGHGRHVLDDGLDLSRTVGWFTALYPIQLSLPPGSGLDQLNYVQTQLQQVPNQGVGFGVLRASEWLPSPPASPGPPLKSPAEVSFNYLGELKVPEPDGFILGLAPEAVSAMRSPDSHCRYRLEIIALIRGEQLHVTWRYSRKLYRHSTLTQLSQRYINNLKSLIADGQQPNQTSRSDFTAARVDTRQLNQLMTKLQAKGRR